MAAETAWLTLADVVAATGGGLAAGRLETALAGVSIDSRTLLPGELFVAVRGPRFDGHDFLAEAAARGARAAVVHREAASPEGLALVRVEDTTRALGDLARHVRRRSSAPVVGLTGSVGKTTTKEMTAALLETRGPVLRSEANLNNRYGLPLTLLRLRSEHTAAVLEMGMSAPGEIRALAAVAEPDVAVITRVAPVHLEFFASVDAIADAKAEILEGLRPSGTAVLNGDDPRVRAIGERFSGRVVWFGRDRRCEVSADDARATSSSTRFDLRIHGRTVGVVLPLVGMHFVSDFLAAAAAAWVLGVAPRAMAGVASSLVPAPHRGELRRLGEGVTLLDDCYNSSPEALEAAVAALTLAPARRRVAVLGDMLELGPTAPALHRRSGRSLGGRLDVVVGVGPLAGELLAGAREAGLGAEDLHHFPAAAEAATAAAEIVRPGDAVLVKASRALRLETVVEALVRRFGEGRA